MTSFTLGGATFQLQIGKPEERGISDKSSFKLVKTEAMLDFYRSLKEFKPKTVMEVGMYEGGSLVYFDKLYKPEKIVGLDLRSAPIEALEAYREKNPHMITYYGRYQEKPGTLNAARSNFRDGIDLVIDDASHKYEQTKATFEMLFPLVRAGGHYVIEDWTWSHRPAYQEKGSVWANDPALTNLVFELVLLASQSAVISSIHVDRGLVSVRKGKGIFKPEMFDFSKILRGKDFPLI